MKPITRIIHKVFIVTLLPMAWDAGKFYIRMLDCCDLPMMDFDAFGANRSFAIFFITNPKRAPILAKRTVL